MDALVDALGHVPLPPYIKRDDTLSPIASATRRCLPSAADRLPRQQPASISPGRSWTPSTTRGVERHEVTLHVGYGTFKPVRVTEVEAHEVDPEPYEISERAAAAINRALDEGRRVVAVGTTTTRALEDAAGRGSGRLRPGPAEATTFIYPGFPFRVVGGLLTNFHLPQSSLLMLVAAFAGRERVLAAYREAVVAPLSLL